MSGSTLIDRVKATKAACFANYAALRQSGSSIDESAKKLGLSHSTAYRYEAEYSGKDRGRRRTRTYGVLGKDELARIISRSLRDKRTPIQYVAQLSNALVNLQGYGDEQGPAEKPQPTSVDEWLASLPGAPPLEEIRAQREGGQSSQPGQKKEDPPDGSQ